MIGFVSFTWRTKIVVALLAFVCCDVSTSHAAIQVDINQVPVLVGSPVAGQWYSSTTTGGTASIVSLVGEGGNLETNQPIPVGAGLLTTTFDNDSRAAVTTYDNFGAAATVLGSIQLAYSYYKETVAGGNTAAAPALRLTIQSTAGTGDNFGTLIYEPYWNQGGPTIADPPADVWQAVSIGPTTGQSDANGDLDIGGWWWNGGFEIGSGSGGPPLRSLAEWVTAFQASDPTDFATANLISVSLGVGSFNQGQAGYFDAIAIQTANMDVVYNFDPGVVPEPLTLFIWSLGGGLALAYARRRAE
jgi:hypothetical protein